MPIDISEIEKFSSFELLAKQIVEGFLVGLHKSPFHGFSVEFSEHRFYNPGESTKNIDWKLYARTDKYYVKEFDEETNLRCHLLLDVSNSMFYPKEVNNESVKNLNKIGFTCYAAASILTMLQKQRDASGIFTFTEKLLSETEVKSSKTHYSMLFDHLNGYLNDNYDVQIQETNLNNSIEELAQKIKKRSLVILFTDFINSDTNKLIQALEQLKYGKHEIIVFHVFDEKTEVDLDFNERPYKFVDLESGLELKLSPSEMKLKYKDLIQSQFSEIKEELKKRNIEFNSVDIQKGFNQVLLPYFLKRSKLH